MKRRLQRFVSWAWVFAALWLGACGRAPAPPEAVVEGYFTTLASDPVRNLSLLSPAFHVQHGLHPITTAEADRHRSGGKPPPPSQRPEGASVDAARVAWQMVQMKPLFQELADSLRVSTVEVRTDAAGGASLVRVQVQGRRGPPFEQVFELSSDDRGRWWIDGAEQRGVVPANLAVAAVAHPRASLQERLEREARP